MAVVKKVSVTKIFTFDSAHWLNDYNGPCSRLHGHTYKLEVTLVASELENGMVTDFGELKSLVTRRIINVLDHQCLNDVLGFQTTAENMAGWIADELIPFLAKGVYLSKIRLWETPTSYAEVTIE